MFEHRNLNVVPPWLYTLNVGQSKRMLVKFEITGRGRGGGKAKNKSKQYNQNSYRSPCIVSHISINFAISSLNLQPKYLSQGSRVKKQLESLVLICLSLKIENNLWAAIMSCLIFMFSLRTHSRYSKSWDKWLSLGMESSWTFKYNHVITARQTT